MKFAYRFKCSSSATSSQWYGGSSNSGGQVREFGQVLTVYPNNHLPNNHYTSRLSTSASTSGNQSGSIQGSPLNVQQTETASLTNSDQLMLILSDHKSPIKVRITSESSNPELNNNTIVHIKELQSDQINDRFNRTNASSNTIGGTADGCSGRSNNHTTINGGVKKDELDTKENGLKQCKNQQIRQKKFAIAATQLNRPLSTSQSYSSVCLKNNTFDSIEMTIEPASSCSSIYSKKSQVDQV